MPMTLRSIKGFYPVAQIFTKTEKKQEILRQKTIPRLLKIKK
jgi:hypothetical protein